MLLVLLSPNQMNNQPKIIPIFGDDGEEQLQYVKPILDKSGFKSTSFINSNLISQNSKLPSPFALVRMEKVRSWNDIEQLMNAGHDI